jgi:hypothetical protein
MDWTTKGRAPLARTGAVCLATAVLLCAAAARAEGGAAQGDEGKARRLVALGAEMDLLPTMASALDGELGGSLQGWAGHGRNRLRVVAARLHYPDGLTAAPFADHQSTVAALLFDRFFQDGFRGPWVAVGLEYWWSRIGLAASSERGTWSTPVATAGAGWVFPLWRGLYVNPWGAVHLPFDTGEVHVGSATYKPRSVEAEVSLKVGWSFSWFGTR